MLNNLSKMAQLATDKVKIWLIKDRQAWCTAVHAVTKSRAQLSDWTTTVLHHPPSTLGPSLPTITTCPRKAYLPSTHLSLIPSSREDPSHISFPIGNCSNVFVVFHFAWTSSSKSGYRYFNHINSIILYTSFSFSFFHSNF